ncbi:MAG: serine/threonine protein kinase [Deltaproteobacteria bacterium]|nr:serine/threonine protein kinase [Deltaproteobacteria bacterium]
MGSVWAATHVVTRKAVAVKILHAAIALDETARRRFIREARAACAVEHPNVVDVHDVFQTGDGTPVMVLDLLEGETLAALRRREEKLPLDQMLEIILPVVSAVGTAHARGIVHRDLKPENIFLVTRGDELVDVKVLDFGIAKLTAAEGAAAASGVITKSGALLGTPHYMAPEQAFGDRSIDHQADVWALGVTLFTCLTGTRPVNGDNLGQIVRRLATEEVVPVASLEPSLPKRLTDLIDRMLRRDRSERVADLREAFSVLAELTSASAPSFGPPDVAQKSRGSQQWWELSDDDLPLGDSAADRAVQQDAVCALGTTAPSEPRSDDELPRIPLGNSSRSLAGSKPPACPTSDAPPSLPPSTERMPSKPAPPSNQDQGDISVKAVHADRPPSQPPNKQAPLFAIAVAVLAVVAGVGWLLQARSVDVPIAPASASDEVPVDEPEPTASLADVPPEPSQTPPPATASASTAVASTSASAPAPRVSLRNPPPRKAEPEPTASTASTAPPPPPKPTASDGIIEATPY